MARSFNGIANHAEVVVDLSGQSIITVALWFKMATIYNNTLHSALEYANPAWTSGGFVFIPARAASSGLIGFGNAAATAQWIDTFTTANNTTWQHYLFVFNRGTPSNKAWRNGSPQVMTASTHTVAAYGNFVNSTLNVCSRAAGASQISDGQIAELAIWAGDVTGHITSAPLATISNAVPQSLFSGLSPMLACSVQPLVYIPWLGFDSPEPDYSGAKRSATLTGPAASRHPYTRTLRMPGA